MLDVEEVALLEVGALSSRECRGVVVDDLLLEKICGKHVLALAGLVNKEARRVPAHTDGGLRVGNCLWLWMMMMMVMATMIIMTIMMTIMMMRMITMMMIMMTSLGVHSNEFFSGCHCDP